MQHGGFETGRLDVDPDTGTTVTHHRAFDTLGLMLANGTITPEMHDAGVLFRGQFRAAALDTLRAMPLIRMPGGSGDTITEQNHAARRKVALAMAALGGSTSIAGACVWHVVGCECSIHEWSQRQGWGGRPVGVSQGQGVLQAALGMLAGHYGLCRTGRAA